MLHKLTSPCRARVSSPTNSPACRANGWREEKRQGERERPDSVAEQLCSKAVDWEVSGSIDLRSVQ